MSELFKNYGKQKITPHNRNKKLDIEKEYWDVIYVGANAKHNFKVPRKKEVIQNVAICYRQGTEIKLTKNLLDVTITNLPINPDYPSYMNGCSLVSYVITPEESLNFNFWNTEVYAQIKVFLSNGRIEYSPEYKVQICDSFLRYELPLKDDNNVEDDSEGNTIEVEELEE